MVDEGSRAPFQPGYTYDLSGFNNDNQSASLLLSFYGRYIWSDQPFKFSISAEELLISGNLDSVGIHTAGKSLADAFKAASRDKFPASGHMPDSLLFSSPQYNTWIELVYNQNEDDVLKYAHAIIDHGFPPGVLMIDDNWMDYYGKFSFRRDRFPDAKQMIRDLHRLGFKVMVWFCPFISPDTQIFRELNDNRSLKMDNNGDKTLSWTAATKPAIIGWWNGYSACLDFTNPAARIWYKQQLDGLCATAGENIQRTAAGHDPGADRTASCL